MNEGYLKILDSIASDSPTPGGGSVAALTLAHAHALAAMVANLTLKAEKWSEGHEIAKQILDNSQVCIDESIKLAENDAQAFDAVIAAYRIPKDDSSNRTKSIREATIGAAIVPLETVQASLDLLDKILPFSSVCNANALTDLAAAGELSFSAAKIAQLNVRINIQYISGNDVDSIGKSTDNAIVKCEQSILELRSKCSKRLNW
tara:strand:+ start:6902 stop:7513 length:612 start_codon:yes stop_codon:yes gene_type:complete